MAATVTLLKLKKRALRLADMENTTFISNVDDDDSINELEEIINQAIRWVYNRLVQTYGDEYYTASSDISSVADQEEYNLPADFFKLIAAYYGEGASPSQWYPMRKFPPRNRMNEVRYNVWRYEYRIFGSKLRITPPPAANLVFRIHYVPVPTELTDDTDTFDGINGFEDLVVLEAAIRMRMKEQNEVSDLQTERAIKIQEMENAASNRDANEPEQVIDVEQDSYLDDYAEWEV